MPEVKKAVIPIAGLGTRFLPLSKVLPKELFPLAGIPVLQYIVEEVLASGIKDIVFVSRPEKKLILDYFKKKIKSKKILKAKYRKHFLREISNLNKILKNISFSEVPQKKPLGDGHALLQAENIIKKEPFAVSWSDDVVESKKPCLSQLIKVFKKYQKPVIALYRIPKESFQFYGIVEVKRVKGKIYQVKKIVEKPSIRQAPSNLAVVGRYVLTPEVFKWLKRANYNKKGEIVLDEVLAEKIKEGEEIYGYEFEGKWLECGNKQAYLKSNFYLSLKHPQIKKELRKLL